MELGNAVFGNSRGNYEIDRDRFGDLFCNLMERYGMCNDYDNPRTIITKDFELRPYYLGECTCDGEKADEEWCDKNDHEETCYQTELSKLKKDYDGKNSIVYGFYETQVVTDLLKKHNLPKQGCAVHCDCSYDKRWQSFLESRGGYHRENCEVIQPNFLYKPANLEINWYKYPLRDSYSNRPFTEEELKDIFKKIGYQDNGDAKVE